MMNQTDAKLRQHPFRFYFRHDRPNFARGVIALFFTNLLDSLTPLTLMLAIDAIKVGDRIGLKDGILLYAALMIGVTVFRYWWRIYFSRFHHGVAEDLRNRIFAKFTVLGPSFYQKNPVGQLMSLLTNDVNTFRMAIGPGTLILLDAVFLITMIVPLMIYISPDWTWKTLIFLPLVPFLMRRMERLIHERYRVEQDRLADVSAHAQEIVAGIRVIKSYAQEKNKLDQFGRVSKEYELACNRVARVDAGFEPMMDFAVASGGAILLYFCSSDVVLGQMTLGSFVAFHQYIGKMVWPMSAIGMGISMVEQGRASFDRIRELVQVETDIPDNGKTAITRFDSLEIKNLTFTYPGSQRAALENICLKIESGETIGVVGPVGAGKTTLMQLICRLYPISSDEIRINGVPLDQIQLSSLREMISFVPQDAFLFSDTVAENVALGLSEFPGMEPVRDVTQVVNIDREIEILPEGYSAFLGERGVNLSGGQKQRLTIARALIRKSPVVILDDSLSAVDGSTEQNIVRSLRDALAQRHDRHQTTILVSHRLATLQHADRIVVLNQGRIEGIGTHQELLLTSETYRRLNELQTESRAEAVAASDQDSSLITDRSLA